MQEFIDSLNLPFTGTMLENKYVIDLTSSNDFSNLFNCISNNSKLSCDENPVTTDSNAVYVYTDGYYEVLLNADFDKDIYNMTITER